MTARLRRLATSHLLVIAAALVLGAGLAAGALVGFSAETQTQASTYGGGWVDAPTTLLAPTVSGYGAVLNWTPGVHDVTGQDLYGSDQGTTQNCTGAAYATPFATGLAALAGTATDSRGSGGNGHWICYQIRSTHGSWYAGSNFGIVQVGLVPTGITVTPGGPKTNQVDSGDSITLTFNQNVTNTGSSTITICAFSSNNTILIGDNCASQNDTPTIGTITGYTVSATRSWTQSTVSAPGNTNTVTITVQGTGSGNNDRSAVSGSGAFTSTGSALTSTAGGAVVCTAPNCTWSYSGGF